MYIETDCTITHAGQQFTSGGAVVDHESGVVFAYLSSSQTYSEPMCDRKGDTGRVTTWHGHALGTYRVVSMWKTSGWVSGRMVAVRALIDGKAYHGRGSGSGCCITLRASKG